MIELASLREAIAPRSDMHPADWCAEHVYLEGSELSSRFDPEQFRWWRKPMGHYADYSTRHMVCIVPPGFGKSAFFEAISCWIVSENPGPTLYLTQNDTTAAQWLETRAKKSFRRCGPLQALWPTNERNAFRKDAMIWPHMFFLAGGANISNTQEVSIQHGLSDEGWKWKHGIVREWLARSHNRENRKFVMCSQAGEIASEEGVGQTSELHLEHDKCRKWEFGWRCPSCGVAHPFTFEQLKFDERSDDQSTADTTRRVCPSCATEYADTPAVRRMLHDSLKEDDGYIMVSDDGLRGYEGFHVDYGANWRIAWGVDVMQKLGADRQMAIGDDTLLKAWYQKNRAVGWCDQNSIQKIELRRSGYTEGDYIEARKIDGEQCRFLTADAGLDHWWVTIRAWATGGASKLLFFGYIGRESDLLTLEEKYAVPKNCCFMDVGFQQTEIAEVVARLGWRGIKGKSDTGDNITHLFDWEIKTGPNAGKMEQRLFSKRKITKSKTGKAIEYFHVSTERLQHILQRLIDGEGAEWLAYDDAPPSYAKHLNGERLETKKNAKGREVKKWTRKGAQHGRDCEIYNLAAAFMFKVFRPAVEDLSEDTESG